MGDAACDKERYYDGGDAAGLLRASADIVEFSAFSFAMISRDFDTTRATYRHALTSPSAWSPRIHAAGCQRADYYHLFRPRRATLATARRDGATIAFLCSQRVDLGRLIFLLHDDGLAGWF